MLTFAIGDIHGCRDLLVALLAEIAQAAAGREHRLVCLGDYVDRGPDSAGVLALLRQRQAASPGSLVCLKGNHEELMLRAPLGAETLALWLRNGGETTLDSFGVSRVEDLPQDVMEWVRGCPTFFDDGRRYFVHAGLNPAFNLDSQRDADRLWIRDAFLQAEEHEFGRFVVHGHTPLESFTPDLRRRRVNLDTAAVYGGRLTSAMFEDGQDAPVRFLQVP